MRRARLAEDAGVPLVPGSALLDDVEQAQAEAARIGYPVMLKSTAGGGGIGMQVCDSEAELVRAFDSVRGLGERNFGDAGVFVEAYIATRPASRSPDLRRRGRHGGGPRRARLLDPAAQPEGASRNARPRRCPSTVRTALHDTAVALGEAVDYRSAGTVEFIYDAAREDFYFLEVNTRLQVEHGVTEQVWGVDIVRLDGRARRRRTGRSRGPGCGVVARAAMRSRPGSMPRTRTRISVPAPAC